jgi:hypothetical protein
METVASQIGQSVWLKLAAVAEVDVQMRDAGTSLLAKDVTVFKSPERLIVDAGLDAGMVARDSIYMRAKGQPLMRKAYMFLAKIRFA